MKTKYIIIVVLLILIFFTLKYCMVSPTPEPIKPSPIAKVEVNCQTESLADKVKGNPEAKEFVLSEGECEVKSPIVITQDNVIFRGQGKTKTIVKPTQNLIHTMPVFKIVGVRGITLTGFTIQDGKQGILIMPKKTRGTQVEIFDVLLQNNTNVNLCIIGLDETTNKNPTINSANKTFRDCPVPLKIEKEIEVVKTQKLMDSKRIIPVVSDLSSGAVSRKTFALISECLANPNPESTYINICESDSINSDHGAIITGRSTVAICKPGGGQCTVNIRDNQFSAGVLLYTNSRLEMQDSTLSLAGNGAGLVVSSSTLKLTNSRIDSNSNGVNIIKVSESTFFCDNNSSINDEGSLVECLATTP